MAKKTKEVLEPLAFTRDQIVNLFKVAKLHKTPQKQTDDFLMEQMAELPSNMDDDDLSELEGKDEEAFEVATAIFEAVQKGQQVVIAEAIEDEEEDADIETEADEEEDAEDNQTEIEEDDEEEDDDEEEENEPAPAKKGKATPVKKLPPPPAKKGKAAAPAKPDPKKADKKKAAAKEDKPPRAAGPRAKGVIYHVVKYLSQGSEAKPVTKAKILVALVNKFKERTEEAMAVTVNSQINGQLKHNKGMVIGKKKMKDGTLGYWIEDLGTFELE